MLPILLLVILIMSFALMVLRRDLRGLLLFLAVTSISFYLYTIFVYIAKKGGINGLTSFVLFGSDYFRHILLNKVYTVNKLGFEMALGRYLSPFFLFLSSLNMVGKLKRNNIVKTSIALIILPLISIIIYVPKIFGKISNNEKLMEMVVNFSKAWIVMYLFCIVFLMIREFYLTRLTFFKLKFFMKMLIIFSLLLIYGFYFPQDPAQVYLFYRNEYMWILGLWYLHRGFSSGFYYIVIIGSLVSAIVSIASLIRYFSSTFDEEVVEVKLRLESHSAARGVSFFVHGTKNDLLATRFLLENLRQKYPEEKDAERLATINNGLVKRLETLNKSIKLNSMKLRPVDVSKVLDKALERTREIFVSYPIEISGTSSSQLMLADTTFLSEAIFNVIQNAIEATIENRKKDAIEIDVEYGRMWVEIDISDRGKGISKEQKKHIYEPFCSSKNSSTNWGIGLYFTRSVIKRHFGSISFKPRKDGGTSFSIILPLAGRSHND